MKELLFNGARRDFKDSDGRTPYEFLLTFKDQIDQSEFESLSIVLVLLSTLSILEPTEAMHMLDETPSFEKDEAQLQIHGPRHIREHPALPHLHPPLRCSRFPFHSS